MSASVPASSTRPARPAAEKSQAYETGDYTFTLDLAREWLGLDQEQWDRLVDRSKQNASRGLLRPLELVSGGQCVTMSSVFSCRRLLAATTS